MKQLGNRQCQRQQWHWRQWLISALGLCAGVAHAQLKPLGFYATAPAARAEPISDAAIAAIDDLLRGRSPSSGRVTLTMPKLAENGLSVPLVASVDSPMSATNYVQSLHIIAPANPIATVTRVHFTARSGVAYLSTRVRLADTQSVLGFAQLSDDSIWTGKAHVIVTLGGCLDPVL